MNRRRSRFTVTVSAPAGPEQKVVLAFDPSDARSYYARRGFVVLGVRKGDFRQDSRPSGVRSRLLIAEARAVAAEFFGLTLPLDIAQDSRQGGRYGVHQAHPTGGNVYIRNGRIGFLSTATGFKHRIRVKSWLDPQQAGETLWHELAHAMQFERDAMPRMASDGPEAVLRSWHASYRDGTSYNRKPYEVEARSYEPFNAERPLAR